MNQLDHRSINNLWKHFHGENFFPGEAKNYPNLKLGTAPSSRQLF